MKIDALVDLRGLHTVIPWDELDTFDDVVAWLRLHQPGRVYDRPRARPVPISAVAA